MDRWGYHVLQVIPGPVYDTHSYLTLSLVLFVFMWTPKMRIYKIVHSYISYIYTFIQYRYLRCERYWLQLGAIEVCNFLGSVIIPVWTILCLNSPMVCVCVVMACLSIMYCHNDNAIQRVLKLLL